MGSTEVSVGHIIDWIERETPLTKNQRFTSVDLEARGLPPEELLRAALDDLIKAVDYIEEHRIELKPVLVIPLAVRGNKLSAEAPQTYKELVLQISSSEALTLYLARYDMHSFHNTDEEYKLPLQSIFSSLDQSKLATYYREFRDERSILQGWEFSRCIYIEYFSDAYI